MTAQKHLQVLGWVFHSCHGPWLLRVYDLRQITDQNRNWMEFKDEALV